MRSMAVCPGGATIVSGSDDKTLRVWRAADGALLRTLEGHTDWVVVGGRESRRCDDRQRLCG